MSIGKGVDVIKDPIPGTSAVPVELEGLPDRETPLTVMVNPEIDPWPISLPQMRQQIHQCVSVEEARSLHKALGEAIEVCEKLVATP